MAAAITERHGASTTVRTALVAQSAEVLDKVNKAFGM